MSTVVVVGGGYGGVTAAKALDDVADVVLIEPREPSCTTSRRCVSWLTPRLFFPYDRLLTRGRVVRDRAIQVGATAVTLGSGERIDTDYIVLATGSTYPFPAKVDVTDSGEASAKLQRTHRSLAEAVHVLLLGAGPAGLELAGEIKAAWPAKAVTIVDPAPDVLATTGLPGELKTELSIRRPARGS